MHPMLRLTKEEKLYCDYYESQGKRGVLERRYPETIVLTAAQPSATIRHLTTRRARVFMVTWSGQVFAARVEVQNSTGEHLTVNGSVHLPCLCGTMPLSTYSRRVDVVTPSQQHQLASRWTFVIEPNTVLEAGQQLTFTYSLEDSTDSPPKDGWLIKHIVHAWEFPNWQGGIL